MDERVTCLEKSISIWRELGVEYVLEEAQSKLILGFCHLIRFPYDIQGIQLINESLTVFQKADNVWWHTYALNLLLTTDLMDRDAEAARSILQKETILWQKTGDLWGQAFSIWDYGLFYLIQGAFVKAQGYLQKSLEIFTKFGTISITCRIMRELGKIAYTLHEYDQAKAYLDNSYILAQEVGYYDTCASIQCVQGFLSIQKGEGKNAEMLLLEALKSAQKLANIDVLIHCVAGFAALNLLCKKLDYAVQLFSVCYAHLDAIRSTTITYKRIDIDPYLECCRAKLEKDVFDKAWVKGSALSLDQALHIAQESLNLIPR